MAFNKIFIKKGFLNSLLFSGIIFANTINSYSSSSDTQESINIKRDKIHIRAVEMTEATEFPANPSKWKCKWCYFGKQNMCREKYEEY